MSWTSFPGAKQYKLQVSPDGYLRRFGTDHELDPDQDHLGHQPGAGRAWHVLRPGPGRAQTGASPPRSRARSPTPSRARGCAGAEPGGERRRHRHRARLGAGPRRGDLPAADRRRRQLRLPGGRPAEHHGHALLAAEDHRERHLLLAGPPGRRLGQRPRLGGRRSSHVPARVAGPGAPGVPRRRGDGGRPFYYQWSPSERASAPQEDLALSSSYTLEVATSPTFQAPSCAATRCRRPGSPRGTNTCWPTAPGTYYWRVIGHDDWSSNRPATDQPSAEVRSFTYEPSAHHHLSRRRRARDDPDASLEPRSRRGRTGSPSLRRGGPFTVTTAATSYTHDATLDPGDYSWQVQTLARTTVRALVHLQPGSFHVDPLPVATGANPDPLLTLGAKVPDAHVDAVEDAKQYEVWANRPPARVHDDQREFEYAAGESLDGAYLDPGNYDWSSMRSTSTPR